MVECENAYLEYVSPWVWVPAQTEKRERGKGEGAWEESRGEREVSLGM